MFGIENYLGFVLAAILLNLTPGTDTMYIITRSVSHGSAAGFYSVLGIISGILVHTVFAALGLSIILINSPLAFTIVKYIGASYLCYLGIKMLMSKQPSLLANHLPKSSPSVPANSIAHWQIYKQGVLTNVFNPKVALFFLAFFPQFIDPSYAHSALSFLILGLSFALTGFVWCSCLALLASKFSANLRKNPAIEVLLNKISGVVFIGLGVKLLTEKE
ncbi:resistance to homoserine/threonine (RhtB) family protein [Psychrobacter pacificensis]|uniref:Lysine transporter LysE n=1 Tax=Psychrobacter pacificensis TaxID=112002 RepID=A0A1G6Y431_9GAMM|nr:LysE family translocator [Psychrobacter pacificensis]GLR29574.1 lysine transporter LysE [Psychrobacter pacificensis]SDD84703.1 resistance to homoserine/threonine (RhtB) family protein [Psychrobacter pacificensis]HBD03453.1 LysE family translocator [Psychrobacter sp.]